MSTARAGGCSSLRRAAVTAIRRRWRAESRRGESVLPGSETDATGVVSLLENLITGYLHVATGSFIGASPLDSGNQQAGARNALGGVPFQTVWETDASGINLYQSPSWYHYIGSGPGSSFGQGWLDYYHPEDRGGATGRLEPLLASHPASSRTTSRPASAGTMGSTAGFASRAHHCGCREGRWSSGSAPAPTSTTRRAVLQPGQPRPRTPRRARRHALGSQVWNDVSS